MEIWKDIDGYIGLYQVSNLGRVKSLNYNKTNKEQILKPNPNTFGYPSVVLWKNRKYKAYSVHRLVAQAFIPNPHNKPFIDHINTIRTDNRVDNLRWCTYRENSNNPISKEKKRGELNPMYGKYGKLNHRSKPIIQLTLNNDFIKMWDSLRDIERELGFNSGNISQCCNGKRNTANGYKWCFAS